MEMCLAGLWLYASCLIALACLLKSNDDIDELIVGCAPGKRLGARHHLNCFPWLLIDVKGIGPIACPQINWPPSA